MNAPSRVKEGAACPRVAESCEQGQGRAGYDTALARRAFPATWSGCARHPSFAAFGTA